MTSIAECGRISASYKALIVSHDLLLSRIEERLAALKLSERKALLKADLHVDTIRSIRRGYRPKVLTLRALARVLAVPDDYLTSAVGPEAEAPVSQNPALEQVYVRGAVQAGIWQEAIEWPTDDWYPVSVPRDDQYGGISRWALEVRGNSMNMTYPPRTVLVCVRFGDIGDVPRTGDHVICLRRSPTGEHEATVKEYQLTEDGRHILWPRSTDPEFQTPVVLDQMPLLDGLGGHDEITRPDHIDDGGAPDVMISGLVVWSVRPVTRRPPP